MVLDRATGQNHSIQFRVARPLGRKLHLVPRLDPPVLHHRRPRSHRTPNDRSHRRRCIRSIISGQSSLDDVQFTSDGRTMIYTEESGSRPLEIFRARRRRATSAGGAGDGTHSYQRCAPLQRHANPARRIVGRCRRQIPRPLLHHQAPQLHASGAKYPVVFLIHGGPQGAWGESWTYFAGTPKSSLSARLRSRAAQPPRLHRLRPKNSLTISTAIGAANPTTTS